MAGAPQSGLHQDESQVLGLVGPRFDEPERMGILSAMPPVGRGTDPDATGGANRLPFQGR